MGRAWAAARQAFRASGRSLRSPSQRAASNLPSASTVPTPMMVPAAPAKAHGLISFRVGRYPVEGPERCTISFRPVLWGSRSRARGRRPRGSGSDLGNHWGCRNRRCLMCAQNLWSHSFEIVHWTSSAYCLSKVSFRSVPSWAASKYLLPGDL